MEEGEKREIKIRDAIKHLAEIASGLIRGGIIPVEFRELSWKGKGEEKKIKKGRREVVEIRCFKGTFDRFLTIWFSNYWFLEVILILLFQKGSCSKLFWNLNL